MHSKNQNSHSEPRKAESAFRSAFERLKTGATERLPKGTPISQNNVAREAGRDPSALRKSRFPQLIDEIQRCMREEGGVTRQPNNEVGEQKRNSRSLEEKIATLQLQRDHIASRLIEAERTILELNLEIIRLEALRESRNIASLSDAAQKARGMSTPRRT